jgi:hypothetical protein
MRHPFDGITEVGSKALSPTRRSMLGRMFAATAGLLGLNHVAAAQQVQIRLTKVATEAGEESTKAIGEEGGRRDILDNQALARTPRPAPQSVDRTPAELEIAWKALADANPAKAEAAINTLYSAKQVVPFLKDHLKIDATPMDGNRVKELIKDLDSDEFSVREKASSALLAMGPAVKPLLQVDAPSLEVKRRLEMIALKLKDAPAVVQARRGLQVLTELPDRSARIVVEQLSKETPATWLAIEAKTALVTPALPAQPKRIPQADQVTTLALGEEGGRR